jgi:NAD(P)-dependent dehydrogenase (short-subunit alcohol dehydrogenase family)
MGGNLIDKVVVVTGGGRGYGEHMAQAIAKEGARVVVTGRTQSECEKSANDINRDGGTALAIVADVASTEEVRAMAKATLDEFGHIDVLINNAAYPGPVGTTAEVDEAEWRYTLDVNLTGSFRCVQAVLPGMMAQESGHIINLSSGTARLGYRHIRSLGYTTSKYAIEGFSSGLAVELEPYGIRVNAFTPGLAETRFLSNMPDGYLTGLKCQTPDHVGPPIVHLLGSEICSGNAFEALPWLDANGLLERYSYVHA